MRKRKGSKMVKSDSKVGAISTFLQRLEQVARTKGSVLYFRGHSKHSYRMEPSIFRNTGWIANEATMLKELILRCPNDFSGGLSTFQCLVKMQHYSLPTRLLDVTSNPLVALYFACTTHDKDDEDGEVIVVGFDVDEVKYYDSDTVSVLANVCRRPRDFSVPSITDVTLFNQQDEIKLLLHDIRQDKPHFEPAIRPGDLGRVICVKPMLDNPRIIKQEGAFLLFGVDGNKSKATTLEARSVIEKITINRDKKKEISTQLEALGISRATMFPEIEQVANHIKDSYFVPRVDLAKLDDSEQRVFSSLRTGPAKSIHEVAAETGMTARSASHYVSKLLEMGFVERMGSGRNVQWRTKESSPIPPA